MKDLRNPALAAGLILAALLAGSGYARVLHGEFQFDDAPELVENPALRDLGSFARCGAWAVGAGRALTHFTFAVQYQVAKLDPLPYHAVNVALHLATALLLYLLGRRTLEAIGWPRPRAVALAAAGLFALHPIQTETVSYIAQRAEGLAALLTVSAILLLRGAEMRGRTLPGALLLLGGAAAFLLGLEAKPTAAVVPLLFILHAEIFPPSGAASRTLRARRLAIAIPLAMVSTWAGLAAVGSVAGSRTAGFDMPSVGARAHLLTQVRVLFRYLALIAWPAGQNVDTDVRWSSSLADPAALVAIGALAAVLAAAVAAIRGSSREGASHVALAGRVAAFGLLWLIVALLPTFAVPLLDPMAEHRIYLGSWGVFLAAAVAADFALRRIAPSPAVSAGVALAAWAALAVALHARNAVWETNVALWTDAAAKSPAKARPHAALGFALAERGRRSEAIAEMQAALRAGGPTLVEAPILNNLAIELLDAGRLDEARAEAERAIAADPSRGDAYNTLGEVLRTAGDLRAAAEQFSRAAKLLPVNPAPRFNLALTLERLGRREDACAAWARYADLEWNAADAASSRAHARELGCR